MFPSNLVYFDQIWHILKLYDLAQKVPDDTAIRLLNTHWPWQNPGPPQHTDPSLSWVTPCLSLCVLWLPCAPPSGLIVDTPIRFKHYTNAAGEFTWLQPKWKESEEEEDWGWGGESTEEEVEEEEDLKQEENVLKEEEDQASTDIVVSCWERHNISEAF